MTSRHFFSFPFNFDWEKSWNSWAHNLKDRVDKSIEIDSYKYSGYEQHVKHCLRCRLILLRKQIFFMNVIYNEERQ